LLIKKQTILIKIILVLSVLICGFIGIQFVQILNEPMNLWSEPLPTAQCGVVLTGATGRVREAFEYLAQKKIQKLIVSGVYKNSKLHEVFPYLPFYPEIHTTDIFLEKRSETTYGNAKQSLIIAENLKCKSIVLVTSQIHMRRAYRIFKMTFPEDIEIKKLSLPNSKTEKNFFDLCLEVIKSLFYFVLSLA